MKTKSQKEELDWGDASVSQGLPTFVHQLAKKLGKRSVELSLYLTNLRKNKAADTSSQTSSLRTLRL